MAEHYTTHQSCLYEHPNEYTLQHDALFLQNPSPHNFFLSVHLPNKFYVWKLFFSVYILLCLYLFLSVCLSVLCLSSQQTNVRRGNCLCLFLHILRCFLSTLFILSILISGYLFNIIFIIIVAALDFFHCRLQSVAYLR